MLLTVGLTMQALGMLGMPLHALPPEKSPFEVSLPAALPLTGMPAGDAASAGQRDASAAPAADAAAAWSA